MSFILDALRKSESERRQDERPSITRIPDAVQQRGVPSWAVATIAVLGVGLVALTGALILTGARGVPPAELGASTAGAPASSARTPRASYAAGSPSTSPASRADSAITRVETLALPRPEAETGSAASPETALGAAAGDAHRLSGESSALAAAARGTPADPPVRAAPSRAASGAAARPRLPPIDAILPSYALEAGGLGLPELRLELLAFDDDPSLRFVFINGKKYVEGDTLAEGPRLIGINARGAVLLAGERQLQLEQR